MSQRRARPSHVVPQSTAPCASGGQTRTELTTVQLDDAGKKRNCLKPSEAPHTTGFSFEDQQSRMRALHSGKILPLLGIPMDTSEPFSAGIQAPGLQFMCAGKGCKEKLKKPPLWRWSQLSDFEQSATYEAVHLSTSVQQVALNS